MKNSYPYIQNDSRLTEIKMARRNKPPPLWQSLGQRYHKQIIQIANNDYVTCNKHYDVTSICSGVQLSRLTDLTRDM